MHQWSKKRKKEFKQTIYYYYLFTNTLLILFSPLISNYLFDKLFTIINFHSKKKKKKNHLFHLFSRYLIFQQILRIPPNTFSSLLKQYSSSPRVIPSLRFPKEEKELPLSSTPLFPLSYPSSSRVNTVTFTRGKRKSAKPKFLTTCSIKPNGEIHSSHFSPFSFSSPPLSFHVSRETPSKTTREGWRGEINNEKFHPTASREERSSFSSSSSIPSSPWKFILITSRLASFVVRCMRRGEEVGAKKECPIRLEVCRR